jgi:NAD(P)-dependent dehydrogenase (short-subunit alcohol dehydrogenase family)
MTTRRVALVTGGTDGIGKATANRLLDEGWEVVIVGRSPARCAATVAELGGGEAGARVSAIVADLSLLAETRMAGAEFLAAHERLDFLFLNANAITQTRVLTSEGFETNFTLGYLSRTLMARQLEGVLTATPGSQILAVVGLNKSRLDFDDLTMAKGFKGMAALGRWQWAMQVYAREWNARNLAPMNIYMPGIVKTKILESEPSLVTRTMIKAVYAVRAVSVEQSAGYVVDVLRDVAEHHRRDAYYSVKTLKPRRNLGDLPGDQDTLWKLTQDLLQPYLQRSDVARSS